MTHETSFRGADGSKNDPFDRKSTGFGLQARPVHEGRSTMNENAPAAFNRRVVSSQPRRKRERSSHQSRCRARSGATLSFTDQEGAPASKPICVMAVAPSHPGAMWL